MVREKPGRRRLAEGALPDGGRVFLKHLLPSDDAGKGWRRRLAGSPGAREFRTLRRLRAAGVPVVEPLALFESEAGDSIVATRFLEGEPLDQALLRPARERRMLLQALGRAIASLHAARVAHRDLHRENVWVAAEGPVLVDLQQAAPLWLPGLRWHDLGEIDASLAPLLSLADRVRLRAAALGLARPYDARARDRVRRMGRASEQRLRAHVESRTRRCLRPGRLYARIEGAAGEGFRLRSQGEDEVARAFANDAPGVTRHEGVAARDAWQAGHGLRARGIGAPLPKAFALRDGQGLLWLEPVHPVGSVTANEVISLGVALRRHAVAVPEDAALCRDELGRIGPSDLARVHFRPRLSDDEARAVDGRVDRALAEIDADERARERYARRVSFYAETVVQRK